MIKKLLSASFLAAFALSATAYEVGEYAYTKVGKFEITGGNLVKNGKFSEGATGTEGWTAIDKTLLLTTTFSMVGEAGPNGTNTLKVLEGQTALTNGMYQIVPIEKGGAYIVSLKVMGSLPGFTDLDMTSGNTNYINAYYNTNGALATVDGTNLYYGENANVTNEDGTLGNGICGGYGFSFTETGFTEAVFSIDAPAEGNIIIDFRGLNEGLEIAEVCCHPANAVYDDRIARDRIAYFQKYLQSEGVEERIYYSDFLECVQAVEDALAQNVSPDEMTIHMDNLESVWTEFVAENFENVIDFIPTTDGSSNTGNNSANWMYWTSHNNNLVNNYGGKAPWSWTTDRWAHKQQKGADGKYQSLPNVPMQIQWMRGAGSGWNNIATLTATLSPGTYYWGVSGSGGMMTLNKNRWARSWANECAETKLFFNGDTILVDTLNAARFQDYVVEFKLEENKEVTLGIICNNLNDADGFDVHFINPVLYKLKVAGELSEEQKAYLAAVELQLEALKGRLDVAYGYISEANDTLPWGKATLQEGATEAQARYDAWAALSQDDILGMMDNEEKLNDTIMNSGVRFLNNNYINPFLNMNKPFTDMPGAIVAAEGVLDMRIYASSTKKGDLETSIAASKAMYAEKLKVAFSTEDSLALVNQRESMNALVEEFKLAIDAITLVDIDFNGAEFIETPATDEADAFYTINGAKGSMVFTDITGTYSYLLGYNGTDSLNMLRVGNSEAVVAIEGALPKASDIVNIKFDWYAGKLTKSKAGFKVLSEAGDTICALFYSSYDANDDINSLGINYGSAIPGVGSSTASNAAIAAASNKTQFDIVLDYGARKMYCTTASSKGTFITEAVDLRGYAPAKFVVYSNYSNADRRCWFDNLKIYNIAAEPTDGIGAIQVVKPMADGAIYNVMGQRIMKAVKGQLFIQNGVKQIAK